MVMVSKGRLSQKTPIWTSLASHDNGKPLQARLSSVNQYPPTYLPTYLPAYLPTYTSKFKSTNNRVLHSSRNFNISPTTVPRDPERITPQQHLLCHHLPSDHVDRLLGSLLTAPYHLLIAIAVCLIQRLVTLDTPSHMPWVFGTGDLT